MAKPALKDCEDMPEHPSEKRVSARQSGTNSFVRGGGKGKGKGKHKRHVKK
jgi:hypothetical protein